MQVERGPFINAEIEVHPSEAAAAVNEHYVCWRWVIPIFVLLMLYNCAIPITILLTEESKNDTASAALERRSRELLKRLKDPYLNLTAYGDFYVHDHDGSIIRTSKTSWLQDDKNHRLKITVGKMGTKSWVGDYYFFEKGTYVIAPVHSRHIQVSAVCTYIDDWGYFDELERYRLHLGYEGRRFRIEGGNKRRLMYVFSGLINKTKGAEFVQRMFEEQTLLPIGMIRIPLEPEMYAYTEFNYQVDLINTDLPAEEHFQLPSICYSQVSSA
ncbi:hypothetical protein M513_06724 [Trichuris suis]|uniref:Uncharacterized protein n=1 Tax=Trichuris suis TaxID=68888 RepID=A0A085M547_9BILA|nr:hypothetical protein M513_06724 [Trichuris suis]